MTRALYGLILWMHPPRFRRRFANEMLSIFDEAATSYARFDLMVDVLQSLVRQWMRSACGWRVFGGFAGSIFQVWWFVYPRRAHQSWSENANALTPYLREWLVVALATLCCLFLGVVALMAWNLQCQRRRSKTRKEFPRTSAFLVLGAMAFGLRAQGPSHSQHLTQLITVEQDVRLEVLDWGGTGRPLVFLAGAGFDAHVFDAFAPKFTSRHHVYGVTRRGFGASSAPEPTEDNYSSDRLGDDVLRVMEALQLDRPVLVGHSLAGEEMSSIGSRCPEKVSGLVYLDAAYSYAYYGPQIGDPIIDAVDLSKRLTGFLSHGFRDSQDLYALQVASAQLDKDLQALEKQRSLMPPPAPRSKDAPPPAAIPVALSKGRQKYTKIHAPSLAIFADPHDFGSLYADDPKARAAVIENDRETTSAQADAFRLGVPSARVVRIPNADHFVFRSNEEQVIREMNAFLVALP